jgi:hypothetical protein
VVATGKACVRIAPIVVANVFEELMNVRGIGEKSFLKLKPLITVPAKSEKPGQ